MMVMSAASIPKKTTRRKQLFATHNPSIVPQLGLRPESGHPGAIRARRLVSPVTGLGRKV
jgi:hypothetical protein